MYTIKLLSVMIACFLVSCRSIDGTAADAADDNHTGKVDDSDTDGDSISPRDLSTDPSPDCWEENFIYTYVSDASKLRPYTCINGYLAVVKKALTNLVLPNLTSVGESIEISHNGYMESLELSALTSVDGYLEIYNNRYLTRLDLSALTSVEGDLLIYVNDDLTSLDLSALTSIGGSLEIYGNNDLTRLDLSALTSVGGYISIYDNDALPPCTECDLLKQLVELSGEFDFSDIQPDTCADCY